MRRPTTLAEIARRAGVSLGTASNTFNRPDLVRPEVRATVQAVAQRLGYAGPDPVGRMLMGGRANMIGVLPPGDMPVATAFQSPFFREFMMGIAQVCDERGASLVVLLGSADRKAWAIANAVVDGFVLGHRDELALAAARRRKVPCVVMDMEASDAASLRIAARDGARLATRHVLDLEHRRFAIVAVRRSPAPPEIRPLSSVPPLASGVPLDEDKLEGCREALLAAGVPLEEVPVGDAYLHPPWSAVGASTVLDAAPEATAVLAMSDRNATAILAETASHGLSVPRDLSVVGFDDAPEAGTARPPLTTVAQPIVEKGRRAAALLFEGAPPGRVILPVKLVVRGSTAPPRPA